MAKYRKHTLPALLMMFGAAACSPGDFLNQIDGYGQDQNVTEAEDITPLYVGSTDVDAIVRLGEDLMSIGYDIGACQANGVFTSEMEDAVKWFENKNGFEEDGIADGAAAAETQQDRFNNVTRIRKVYAPSHVRASAADRDVIRQYQAALIIMGYDLSECLANGVMNNETSNAIKTFLIDHQIYPATGILDFETQDGIQRALIARGDALSSDTTFTDVMSARAGSVESDSPVVLELAIQMRKNALAQTRDYYINQRGVPEYLAHDIHNAALIVGWDIDYLFQTNIQESSSRPWASPDCDNCTALGPFQFIEQTWLGMIKNHGAKYGYSDLADSISYNGSRYTVTGDKGDYILGLRTDTKLASLMAAEYARENYESLVDALGVANVGKTEVYLAHFFGSTNAIRFIKAYQENPQFNAAEKFSAAAASNENIFYENGDLSQPNTGEDIYRYFESKIAPTDDNSLDIGQRMDTSAANDVNLAVPSVHQLRR